MPEINLLCIRQKKAIGRSFGGLRLVKLNKRQSERKGYADNFFCMGVLYGNLYQVYSKENYKKRDFVCGAYDLVEGIECPLPCDYIRSLPRDRMDDAYLREFPRAFFSTVRWKSGGNGTAIFRSSCAFFGGVCNRAYCVFGARTCRSARKNCRLYRTCEGS